MSLNQMSDESVKGHGNVVTGSPPGQHGRSTRPTLTAWKALGPPLNRIDIQAEVSSMQIAHQLYRVGFRNVLAAPAFDAQPVAGPGEFTTVSR